MIKQPFTPRDFLLSHNRDIMDRIARIWDEVFGPETPGGLHSLTRQKVILEGVGWTLKQYPYSDETGYYISFRMEPGETRKEYQDKARLLTKKFIALFPKKIKPASFEGHEKFAEGGVVTVMVMTGSFNIGD